MLLNSYRISRFSTSFQLLKETFHTRKQKEAKKKKKNGGVSQKFLDKAILWPTLLKAETSEQMGRLNEMLKNEEDWGSIERRGLCLANLELTRIGHDFVSGRNVDLKMIGKRGMHQKWIRPLTPINISRIDEQNKLTKISDGHIISTNGYNIKCSIYEKEKDVDLGQNYLILPSSNSPIITSLKTIAEEPEKLSDDSKHLINLTYRATLMPSLHDRKIKSLAETLNSSQIAAISAVMNSQRNLLCIQGPPGTGKTRVIAESVLKLIEKKNRVVICAPSHVAVKNVYEATLRRLKEEGWDEERIEKKLLSISEGYEDRLEEHQNYPVIVEHSKMFFNENDELTKNKIKKYINKLKEESYSDIFGEKLAIFSTLHSSILKRLKWYGFDGSTIIIDEAAQCSEPVTWIPILSMRKCKKVVLVGDHKQLPAVVMADESRKHKLEVSLMQRLTEEFKGCNLNILLNQQHRMNSKIMEWSNELFYDSQLTSHENVENIRLSDLYPNLSIDNPINSPILMIDMDRIENRTRETRDESVSSFVNREELEIINRYVNRLIYDVGVDAEKIVVISPYYAQNEELRKLLPNNVNVKTVDAFQGNESEIVIFCLVRDNKNETIGFLRDTRRLNVAITRAKRQFILIGSAKMMKSNKDLKKLCRFFEKENSIYGEEIFNHFDDVKLPKNIGKYRY
ncbi:unnamed protein product [Caenorhabditis angaria]|uniref:Helicase ATP-binding domain-containing protein n=1 Tax=Caenorhabditis angaria TaxID=860376 RepID=A0A9P1MVZ9_9PELO|nr:unnamed protein product [Caenorhabditis angaria]